MKAVDLSPSMVEAIVAMQRDAETVKVLIQEVQKFILKVNVEGDKEKAAQAFQCMINLDSVSGYCEAFVCENTQS